MTTVGANKQAALETLETIRYCKEELGLCTAVGLSNISFGLPERSYVNGAFAAMAIQNGLTMAIANPSNDLLMGLACAADLLKDKPQADETYITRVQQIKERQTFAAHIPGNVPAGAGATEQQTAAGTGRQQAASEASSGTPDSGAKMAASAQTPVFEAVLKGRKNGIVEKVQEEHAI